MPRPLIAAATVAVLAVGWLLFRPGELVPATLAPQTADAGGVEISVTPVRLDGAAALFEIAFDTHTVDLDLDPAAVSALVVGARSWGPPRWDGDPAGGHHRSGRLTFPAGGPARGAVELSISGLPQPVLFEWSRP